MTNKLPVAKVVKKGTASIWRFFIEIHHSSFVLLNLLAGNKYVVANRDKIKADLAKMYQDQGTEASGILATFFKTEEANKTLEFSYLESTIGRMFYSRLIDNFQTYLKEILSEVARVEPRVLKSKDSEPLEFILGFETMSELTNAIAEKKIRTLSYKGIDDIAKFFDSALGIKLFKSDAEKLSVNILIKQRNLIVHNRGIVSKEFELEFPQLGLKEGQTLNFNNAYISKIATIIGNFVIDLDIEIAKKFNLKLDNPPY